MLKIQIDKLAIPSFGVQKMSMWENNSHAIVKLDKTVYNTIMDGNFCSGHQTTLSGFNVMSTWTFVEV